MCIRWLWQQKRVVLLNIEIENMLNIENVSYYNLLLQFRIPLYLETYIYIHIILLCVGSYCPMDGLYICLYE